MNRRGLVLVAVAVLVLGACGGSSSDSGRDRNIAGGGEVSQQIAPYQVALWSTRFSNGVPTDYGNACGGTIIAPQWVLTADHCVPRDEKNQMHPDYVMVGSGNPDYWASINDARNVRWGTAVYAGRNTSDPNPGLDLMLIKVNRPFAFSPTVQPAALPIGFDGGTWPASDTTGLITGWGETLDSAARTKLRGVEMKVNALFVDLYCMDGVNYSAYFAIPFPATSLCLLRPSPDVFASACKGDSGGPFVVTIEDKKYLVGVASQAQAPPGSTNLCTGTTPANYVRVTAGLDWIIPGIVRDLVASTTSNSVTLTWSAPATIPARPISDYQIDVRTTGSSTWSTLNDGVSTSTSATFTDLKDGDSLEFRVSAINDVNSADASMRVFANTSLIVGTPPTTTSTTSTTTTAAPTTTTLASVTTTIAPSTTARTVVIGPRPTTTTATTTTVATPAVTSTVVAATAATKPTTAPAPTAATKPTTAPAPTTTPASPPNLNTVEDKAFSNPTMKAPPEVANLVPPAAKTVDASPQPVVGATWSATDVARTGNVNLPTGGLVSVSVPAKSAKVCKSNGSGLTIVGKGTCKATVSVKVGSGKPKNKTVSIKVS